MDVFHPEEQHDSTVRSHTQTYFVLEEDDELGPQDEAAQLCRLGERKNREAERRFMTILLIFPQTFAISFL